MNRGHPYLELWHWIYDRIESETDESKQENMVKIQMALNIGIDQDEQSQRNGAEQALNIARDLGLDLFVKNIESTMRELIHLSYWNGFFKNEKVDLVAEAREIQEQIEWLADAKEWGDNLQPDLTKTQSARQVVKSTQSDPRNQSEQEHDEAAADWDGLRMELRGGG